MIRNNLFNYIYKVIRSLYYKIYSLLGSFDHPAYFIEEIDIKKNLVIIRCRGTRTVIKSNIESIINNMVLICGLPAFQACLIGNCFGRSLKSRFDYNKDDTNNMNSTSFLLNNRCGKYKIIFQNRDGKLGYMDVYTKQLFVADPIVVVSDKILISNFDPTQACYIGILAGINTEKRLNSKSNFHVKKMLNNVIPLKVHKP